MNHYIDAQCRTMIAMVDAFENSCELAAGQDNGKISKDEAKTIKRIKDSAQKFKNDLSRICLT